MEITQRGIVLTENVDLEWLKSLTPRFFPEYIKFVVNLNTNRVCVGMDVHRDCQINMGDEEALYGGNIFFEDGSIVYESTLNIPHNLKTRRFKGNPRIITDPEMIKMINAVLFAWVEV